MLLCSGEARGQSMCTYGGGNALLYIQADCRIHSAGDLALVRGALVGCSKQPSAGTWLLALLIRNGGT